MGVILETSSMIMLQHKTLGTGVFDGLTEVGRASLSHGAGAAKLTFRARELGVDGNAITVAIVDAGRPIARTQLKEVNGVTAIILRRDAASFLATADEVAAVVNADRTKLLAHGGGSGIVAPLAATALSGGLDPTVVFGCQFKFAQVPNLNAGLFYFNQINNQVVTQIEGTFPVVASTSVKVDLINLTPGLEPIAGETSTFYCTTLTPQDPSFVITDARIMVLPYRAIRIACNLPGQVRVHVRREAAHSTL